MLSLHQIEQDLTQAMKAKNQVLVDTLRGLKTRIQNEKVAKMKDLDETEILQLIRSEVKRRKEAAESFVRGLRQELADKELAEAAILEQYLPAQMSEQDIVSKIEEILGAGSFTAQDFGKAMAAVKAAVGPNADGATVAKLLKERLK